MSLTLPDPNKVPGDANHTSDTNLIIEAINTLKSQVDNIPAGPTGAKGDKGDDGADGLAATVTVGSTNTSAPGGNAAVTNSGNEYNAVLNFTIPRGAQGLKGDKGDTGAQGPTGSPGENAAVSVGTTTTSEPGTSAAVTNSGTTTNAVLEFTIPRGAKGDKGDTGDTGAKGDTGDAATIAVGNVVTGDPGTSAVITNVGTSGAAVFDFTIPRGDVGPAANLGNAAPLDLGTASAGTSSSASREDHVHKMPSAADVGADALGTAASAVSTHAAVTTSVHGITDTANLVYTNDARLSDARTPTAHATSHESGGSDELTLAISQVTNLSNSLPVYQAAQPSTPVTGQVWVDSDATA